MDHKLSTRIEGLKHLGSTTMDVFGAGVREVGDQAGAGVGGDDDTTTITSSSIIGASLRWGVGAFVGWGMGAHAEADGPPKDRPMRGHLCHHRKPLLANTL